MHTQPNKKAAHPHAHTHARTSTDARRLPAAHTAAPACAGRRARAVQTRRELGPLPAAPCRSSRLSGLATAQSVFSHAPPPPPSPRHPCESRRPDPRQTARPPPHASGDGRFVRGASAGRGGAPAVQGGLHLLQPALEPHQPLPRLRAPRLPPPAHPQHHLHPPFLRLAGCGGAAAPQPLETSGEGGGRERRVQAVPAWRARLAFSSSFLSCSLT